MEERQRTPAKTCLSWQQLGLHSGQDHTSTAVSTWGHSTCLNPLPTAGSEEMEMELVFGAGG